MEVKTGISLFFIIFVYFHSHLFKTLAKISLDSIKQNQELREQVLQIIATADDFDIDDPTGK